MPNFSGAPERVQSSAFRNALQFQVERNGTLSDLKILERNGTLNLWEIFSSVPERIFPLLQVILEL